MPKQTAIYHPNKYERIIVGESAIIFGVNHPDKVNCPTGLMVYTSRVVSFDEITGVFETENTTYSPHL